MQIYSLCFSGFRVLLLVGVSVYLKVSLSLTLGFFLQRVKFCRQLIAHNGCYIIKDLVRCRLFALG